MRYTRADTINTPSIPAKERIAYKLPSITKSFLSMLATFDEGGKARFMKKGIHVTCKGKLILKVKRDSNTGLWLVPMWLSSNLNNFLGIVPRLRENIEAAVIEANSIKKN